MWPNLWQRSSAAESPSKLLSSQAWLSFWSTNRLIGPPSLSAIDNVIRHSSLPTQESPSHTRVIRIAELASSAMVEGQTLKSKKYPRKVNCQLAVFSLGEPSQTFWLKVFKRFEIKSPLSESPNSFQLEDQRRMSFLSLALQPPALTLLLALLLFVTSARQSAFCPTELTSC